LNAIRASREDKVSPCQDTGVPIFFVSKFNKEVQEALIKGVKKASRNVPLRCNTVHPLTRKCIKYNVGIGVPYMHLMNSDDFKIGVLLKGAGSENLTRLSMFAPTTRMDEIKNYIIRTMTEDARPCPPVFISIGIGGAPEQALSMAKKALMYRWGRLKKLERQILEGVNKLGIGTFYEGGDITDLDVRLSIAATHSASLPVGIMVQCWALRRAVATIKDREVIYRESW
jgi:fumarate hydratase subunit alpha